MNFREGPQTKTREDIQEMSNNIFILSDAGLIVAFTAE